MKSSLYYFFLFYLSSPTSQSWQKPLLPSCELALSVTISAPTLISHSSPHLPKMPLISCIPCLLLLLLLLLLFLSSISTKPLLSNETESPAVAAKPEMRPVATATVPELRPSVFNERRRLGRFQICALCTCCGGPKGLCLACPCCYAINCNIPNRPFGFCSFIPKTFGVIWLHSVDVCECFGKSQNLSMLDFLQKQNSRKILGEKALALPLLVSKAWFEGKC
ncbi:hypothetical protein M5K25_005212 [Dendrobium thyrsiflorum]|uniref:DUF7866 domain-containing protein n=1 Tax=Dendrobium thyrsiflorum TaxID=117978 RepID=A0ABD0VH27_DENTH